MSRASHLFGLLGLVLTALCLALPASVTIAHDVGHTATPVAVDQHHHHDSDGSVVGAHDHGDTYSDQPAELPYGHDHQTDNVASASAVVVDQSAPVTPAAIAAFVTSRPTSAPPELPPDPHIEPPRFA